jgi:hypothetical protein
MASAVAIPAQTEVLPVPPFPDRTAMISPTQSPPPAIIWLYYKGISHKKQEDFTRVWKFFYQISQNRNTWLVRKIVVYSIRPVAQRIFLEGKALAAHNLLRETIIYLRNCGYLLPFWQKTV